MGEARRAKELGITRPPVTRYKMRTIPVPAVLDDQVATLHAGYRASEKAKGNDDSEGLAAFMVALIQLGIRTLVEKAETQPRVEAGPVEVVTV